MARLDNKFGNASVAAALLVLLTFGTVGALAQQAVPRDPAEPAQGKPQPKILPRPAGAITRQSVDEKVMRALIHEQVSCGTRLTLSSWTDPKRGAGCGRDFIVARFNAIAKESGGKLQVVVDKFEMTSERTGAKPVHLENVYGILPGADPSWPKPFSLSSGTLTHGLLTSWIRRRMRPERMTMLLVPRSAWSRRGCSAKRLPPGMADARPFCLARFPEKSRDCLGPTICSIG